MKFQKINLDNYVKPSRFLSLKTGENRVRVLTDGCMYHVVGKKTAKGFVRAIVGDGDMPKFLQDAEPKLTYGFVVYSFDTGHFHVLEKGPALGDQIVKLLQQKPEKEYMTADIIITRHGEGLSTEYSAQYADESEHLPKEANKDHPEYKMMLKYFED